MSTERKVSGFDPNPLFYWMVKTFVDNKNKLFYSDEHPDGEKKTVTICNEGGSRSGKTFDAFHLIYYICQMNPDRGLKIFVLRGVLKKCREVTLTDFKDTLKSIGDYDKDKLKGENQTPSYELFGNTISFRGLDDEKDSEGYPSDILFINEVLDINQKSFVNGLLMRCDMLCIQDWNPKFTDHWAFEQEKEDNTFFSHTNYSNNKHIPSRVRSRIEGYNPWEFGCVDFKDKELWYNGKLIDSKNQPPPHVRNVENNTADEFRHRVYGYGIRGSAEGLIFKNVSYDDEFPDIAYSYGMDFGFTNDPSTLTKCAETETDIYLELLMYEPTPDADDMDNKLNGLEIEKDVPITADSSDRFVHEKNGTVKMVIDLKKKGWEIAKVSKTKSIIYWTNSMNRKRIHIIKDKKGLWLHAKKEQQNYMYKTIEGKFINQAIDKYNHFWDGSRYRHMSFNKDSIDIESEWE